jgi:hypothetical protein
MRFRLSGTDHRRPGRHRAALALFSSLASCFFLATGVAANPLIQQAVEAGVLNAETALLYRVYEAADPDYLPADYRHTHASGALACGTPVLVEARDAEKQLGPEFGRSLAKVLARPRLQTSVVTPSGHFRVHYSTSGRDSVDTTDDDGNGIPDYVDITVSVLDSVWRLQIDDLGYVVPKSDEGAGGGDEYDVYIREMGRGGTIYYGTTTPEDGRNNTTASYINVDNNFTDPAYGLPTACFGIRGTRELAALRVTIAHEFFHALQFSYYQGGDGRWWQEASATWMEDVAFTEEDDYLQYLCSFILSPSRSVNGGSTLHTDNHVYGASVFAHFLDQRYHRDLVRRVWEEFGRRGDAGMERFDRAIRSFTDEEETLDDAISDFTVWNYFTGSRHIEGLFYEEGAKWPAFELVPLDVEIPEAAESPEPPRTNGTVDHLASAYVLLEPRLRPGGVVIESQLQRFQWRRQLLLVSRGGVEVVPLSLASPVVVRDWDAYTEMVLALTNIDLTNLASEYSVSAVYDSTLTGDQEQPVALSLGQNYPNPFRPGEQGETVLPFELRQSSQNNRLSIFNPAGELIQRFSLGPLRAAAHIQSWDGRNLAGKLVSSGVYYYLLESDGREVAQTMAVIRD